MIICKSCEAVICGNTTVGNLIKEGDTLRRESIAMRDSTKLMKALDIYNTAWSALSANSENHAECIKSIDENYKDAYRSLQGSRA